MEIEDSGGRYEGHLSDHDSDNGHAAGGVLGCGIALKSWVGRPSTAICASFCFSSPVRFSSAWASIKIRRDQA